MQLKGSSVILIRAPGAHATRRSGLRGWLRLGVSAAPLLLLLACTPAPESAPDADTDPTADAGLDADRDSEPPSPDASDDASTAADTGERCPTGRIVTTLHGSVVDEAGAPLEGARPQACVRTGNGTLSCLRPPTSGADGSFAQSVPYDAQCMTGLTFRVSLPGESRSTSYCAVSLPERSPVLAPAAPFVLYRTEPADLLPPEGDPSTVHTIRFAGGLELDVAPASLYFPAGGWDELAMRVVPPDDPGVCFLGDGPAPDALFAFSPEADVSGQDATVRVPNTEGLLPGSAVDLFVLGGLDCTIDAGEVLTEGRWHRFGQGTVEADGRFITSDAGLPCLTWFGYRRASP